MRRDIFHVYRDIFHSSRDIFHEPGCDLFHSSCDLFHNAYLWFISRAPDYVIYFTNAQALVIYFTGICDLFHSRVWFISRPRTLWFVSQRSLWFFSRPGYLGGCWKWPVRLYMGQGDPVYEISNLTTSKLTGVSYLWYHNGSPNDTIRYGRGYGPP